MPLISVIIPMRNAEAWIAQTLGTILSQEAVELEIVVVNDGSTDRSEAFVLAMNDPRIRIVPGPQKGISAAFNQGLVEARGEFLARCDADDLYPPDRLRSQLDFLNRNGEMGAVCGYFTTIDSCGRRITEHRVLPDVGEVTDELLAGVGRSHVCAYLFRTVKLREIGGCREWFVTSEDADLQFRLAEVTRVGYQPINAYDYRLHDSSITHTQKSNQRLFFEKCAKQFLEQRRSGSPDDLQRGKPPTVPEGVITRARASRDQIQDLLLGTAWTLHRMGHKRHAIRAGWRAVKSNPVKLKVWKSFVSLILK